MKKGPGHDSTAIECCDFNFHGPSKSMECAAAEKLFEKTLAPDFPFRYMVFVADGDANVRKTIVDAKFYGDEMVQKEECMYHFRKRVRSDLCEVFNTSWVPFGEDGRRYPFRQHKDTLSVRFSNLFLYTLRKIVVTQTNHRRDEAALDIMSNALQAIPRHYMDHVGATFEERRDKYHVKCSAAFCDFKRNESEQQQYQPTNLDGKPMDGDLWLPKATECDHHQKVLDAIIACFDKLGDKDKMSRCTRYLNQNVNESIHARVYRMINKTLHYSPMHIAFAAEHTILVHNSGYQTGSLLNVFGATDHQLKKLKEKDEIMRMRAEKRTRKTKQVLKEDEVHYKSGYGFELYDPLPDSDEYDKIQAKKQPWRTDDLGEVDEDPDVDYVSEDIVDKP